ncbi:MAG: primosomal protein N' [Gammaproteobacteria bacterium]|nr:primosomal protein N' [Gammaproteobacteria bacterium]
MPNAPVQLEAIARIALPVPLYSAFDYTPPAGENLPAVGARVRVRFAHRTLIGVCVSVNPPDPHAAPKPLLSILDAESIVDAELFDLAHWLADYYHHPLGEVLSTMLPNAAMKGAELTWQPEALWQRTTLQVDLARAPRQRQLLAFIDRNDGSATAVEIRAAGFATAMIDSLAHKGALEPGKRTYTLEPAPTLTAEQRTAVATMKTQLGNFVPNLLDGVTGSGKTEVYLQLIDLVLERGEQALVLVPEIALTPQTVRRFQRRFGATGVMHSNLTDTERMTAWLRCRDGSTRILIGTRSAVLTPFKNLGLIVVDEEHDSSFKQTEGLRYSARDVAVKRAQTLGIPLILGSATPSLESLHNVTTGKYTRHRLFSRATGAAMPQLHVVDIRGQPLRDGISQSLERRIAKHLQADSQVLVFINRRGYAPTYLCTACGWQALCQRCDARMTFHTTPRGLTCHHCGARKPLPSWCPDCERDALVPIGVGTQRTEIGLNERFPNVPVYRIDRDTMRSQRRLEARLEDIRTGAPAILVGTQMLAKGHHFPNVTLVAAINADAGFLSADFKAPERTAQLIIQVAGRAGRAEKPGEVWVQTLQPENPVLKRLIDDGYAAFAEMELEIRRSAGLPPSRPMALIRSETADPTLGATFLAELKSSIGNDVEVLGPAPAPMARVASRYRHQLMLVARTRQQLHRALAGLRGRTGPRALRWAIDVDPYDTF